MSTAKVTTLERAVRGLRQALMDVKPGLTVTEDGYVDQWCQNLLTGTFPTWFESELNEGRGNELAGSGKGCKFCAAHSSSALAVNTFARFKTAPGLLSINDWSGWECFRFEAKCSAGIIQKGRESPPHLDLLAGGSAKVLGVESKCTEHLKMHRPVFSPAWNTLIQDGRRNSEWFKLMEALRSEPSRYRYLDAAQLIKHALGLAHCFSGSTITLLYLYWEPTNHHIFSEFLEHQNEVDRFAKDISGSSPSFRAISYRDLWDEWSRLSSPPWLCEHLTALRARYDIEI